MRKSVAQLNYTAKRGLLRIWSQSLLGGMQQIYMRGVGLKLPKKVLKRHIENKVRAELGLSFKHSDRKVEVFLSSEKLKSEQTKT